MDPHLQSPSAPPTSPGLGCPQCGGQIVPAGAQWRCCGCHYWLCLGCEGTAALDMGYLAGSEPADG